MRKTKIVTIPGIRSEEPGNRDNGKMFLITEMSARQAERWADRAFLAITRSGINLPAGIERSGMAGISEISRLIGGVQFPELSELMDELLTCVQVIPDPKRPTLTRGLQDNGYEGDDIEEVDTRQYLRGEVLAMHINFSLAANILNLIAAASKLTEISEPT